MSRAPPTSHCAVLSVLLAADPSFPLSAEGADEGPRPDGAVLLGILLLLLLLTASASCHLKPLVSAAARAAATREEAGANPLRPRTPFQTGRRSRRSGSGAAAPAPPMSNWRARWLHMGSSPVASC